MRELDEAKSCYAKSNYSGAIEILTELAQAGNGEANLMLGNMYRDGKGVAVNSSEAFQCYVRSHNQGCVEGSKAMANALMHGYGSKRNCKLACRIMQSIASQSEAYKRIA